MISNLVKGVVIISAIWVLTPIVGQAAVIDSMEQRIIKSQILDVLDQVAAIQVSLQQSGRVAGASTMLGCTQIIRPLYRGLNDRLTNGQVTVLQRFLISRPEASWTVGLEASGFYGSQTEEAVKRFQAYHAVVNYGTRYTTGYGAVGRLTIKKIEDISCLNTANVSSNTQSSVESSQGLNYNSSLSVSSQGSPANIGNGDTNGDGQVNIADVVLINRHIQGISLLTGNQLTASDVDGDGKVTVVDFKVVQALSVALISNIDLPIRFGDVDRSGRVDLPDVVLMNRHISNISSLASGVPALAGDVNADGAINGIDTALVTAVNLEVLDRLPAVLGDLNNDYTLNVADVVIGQRFLESLSVPTQRQKYLADVDRDSVLTARDMNLMLEAAVGKITLPVVADPVLRLTYPNSGVFTPVPDPITINWVGLSSGQTLDITLYSYQAPCSGINCPQNPVSRHILAERVSSPRFAWRVGSQIGTEASIPAGNYVMQICVNGSTVCDSSDGRIEIKSAVTTTEPPPAPLPARVVVSGTPLIGVAPLTVNFSAELINMSNCFGQSWSFGDGTNINLTPSCSTNTVILPTQTLTRSHTFSNPGNYRILYTAGSVSAEAVSVTVLPTPISPVPLPTPVPLGGGGSGVTGAISFRDRVTLGFIPNSTISLYMDPGTFIGQQFVPTGYALFNNLMNGWYTAQATAAGYMPGAQRFIITDFSRDPNVTNIIGNRSTSTPSGRLAVSVLPTPPEQDIIAGGANVHFANYQYDTTGSGEDIRLVSSTMQLTFSNGALANELTTCRLFDGATVLTNLTVVNPSGPSPYSGVFTLDTPLIIPRNTQKVLALKCNVNGSATDGGRFTWGMADSANTVAVGVTSNNDIPETVTPAVGQTMTVRRSGLLMITTDSASPSYTVVQAGSMGVTTGMYKLRATNESISFRQLVMRLTNGSPQSIVRVTVWDGATQVGTAFFTGTNRTATSTLTTPVTIPRDSDKSLTIKADFSQIGVGQPGVEGDWIKIDYDATDITGTYGTGMSSGIRINASGSTAVAGVRLFKTYPSFSLDSLPTSGVGDGRLLRARITANNGGDVGLDKLILNIFPSNANVTNVNMYAYTDPSYSNPVAGCNNGGQMMAVNQNLGAGGLVEIYCQTPSGAPSLIQIPAGIPRYFEARATVNGTNTSYSVTTTLGGDASYPPVATMGTEAQINTGSENDVIWSPNTNGFSNQSMSDWTNGYSMPGLPASGLVQTRSN